ncbi:hypothetical protein C3B44_00985 [Corynebacterium yudongzhengii]|uniref:Phage holin family protein n=1 Tax=Corynebacterium yudongzhengii TaxID=2080740 RepID=A0A2U1T5E8_9CORY|nr:phage holin family protein [Corynebacterium yudongzhengii]AWB81089.1 hypothetical protein C3B44_00985 [Corynebacterium yudongzhengii]PWC01219.1 phage holin family protein [Corynebacterium yudongzhengii]
MSTPGNKNGLFTDGSERYSGEVNSIPLSDVDSTKPGETSIGDLVSNATSQMSSLVRGEIELAKTEIVGEAKKAAIGSALFVAAGVIALYSSFFFFFFLAELLSVWLHRWAAFLIVFLVMIVLAAILGLVGFQRFKKMQAPKRTQEQFAKNKEIIPNESNRKARSGSGKGLYTSGSLDFQARAQDGSTAATGPVPNPSR